MQPKKSTWDLPGKGKQDESIMGTNNSSIVSKRSVERLYFPGEDFFRHFVKKPQRRSPTINRGYWLRMRALEYVVHKFLEEPTERKIFVNLGDTLPFQCLAKHPEKCQNAKFVDVDYMKLIKKKCAVVAETEQLRRLLSGMELPASHSNTVLRSDQYLAVGCDLRELEELERTLAAEVDIENCLVLFAAEVSITYMEAGPADALIKWAASFHNSRFCLIEQLLPDGPENPFASTMLRHFDKLSTPLRCVHKYPLIKDQQQRFRDAGWPLAIAHDLWKLWGMPEFLTANQRAALNKIEPFDEWEEFALFASHYFLLFASKSVCLGKDGVYGALLQGDPSSDKIAVKPEAAIPAQIAFHGPAKHQGCRRFAAAAPLKSPAVSYHGGLGAKSRLSSSELILHDVPKIPSSLPGPRPRMCHTLTCLEGGRFLLVGGRASPDDILADCWIYDSPTDKWHRVGDITAPRYRHCAVELPNSQVLVFGGRTNNNDLLNDCVLWTQNSGWKRVCVEGEIPQPCFGATMIAVASGGVLVGGMTAEETVLEGYWEWNFEMGAEGASVKFQNASSKFGSVSGTKNPFCRFGASLVQSPFGSGLLLVGGIHGKRMLKRDEEILFIDTTSHSVATLSLDFGARRPLLVGCSVVSTPEAAMIIGGGAVCFSFGPFWNDGLWTLSAGGRDQLTWKFQEKAVDSNTGDQASVSSYPTISHVQRLSIKSAQDFEGVLNKAEPAILDGLDIGSCSQNWSFAYLKEHIGVRRQVIVHKAEREHMDFKTKNFSYVSQSFGEFLDAVEEGQKLYLRSVSSEEPATKPTELSRDFPEISEDFRLPPELDFVIRNAHSSPLRISGPVVMWLHYDVMANVLCQVRGSKRLMLYPPDDVSHLCFAPGASSSSLNVFEMTLETYPALAYTHPHEAVLHAGDILFIPALWLHTASPTDGASVSVNVFFRNLKAGYAAGKDVYGNRDLQPYEKGRLDLAKMIKGFEQLPVEIGRFYLKRLADELVQKANAFGVSEPADD
ncbi:hypothetical protein GP486_004923 [Trichoglossum hirsutum]|uniref:tRNA wybutosine-synthesizing protein 4 n=1 Tax=Trichoglossum hirsutum TaxID=265104 RepID=A0A9P8LA10_9PEZI|nr:hypothetical protein GP486_004923 [Trichoglossum hirsutum]